MDALLTTFIAALLAEFGDKTQLLVIALAARHPRALPLIAGVAVGALASNIIAAVIGVLLGGFVTMRAASLLLAVALVFAGVAGLMLKRAEDADARWRGGAFLTAAAGAFALEIGDKTQFLTVALAARLDSFAWAAAGATLGVIVASIPAALLGRQMADAVPMRPIRIGIALLFLLAGFIVTINALQLV